MLSITSVEHGEYPVDVVTFVIFLSTTQRAECGLSVGHGHHMAGFGWSQGGVDIDEGLVGGGNIVVGIDIHLDTFHGLLVAFVADCHVALERNIGGGHTWTSSLLLRWLLLLRRGDQHHARIGRRWLWHLVCFERNGSEYHSRHDVFAGVLEDELDGLATGLKVGSNVIVLHRGKLEKRFQVPNIARDALIGLRVEVRKLIRAVGEHSDRLAPLIVRHRRLVSVHLDEGLEAQLIGKQPHGRLERRGGEIA